METVIWSFYILFVHVYLDKVRLDSLHNFTLAKYKKYDEKFEDTKGR